MSGHSKWHSIRHKKGALDAKRGKLFTKIIREITVAAREGGGDPDANPRLRTVVAKAKEANMPKDNIEKAIKKGTGEIEGYSLEEVLYEGYGPNGVAIMIEALTDNRNRTTAEVRSVLTKNGGNLGETGCVSWIFDKRGILTMSAREYDENSVMEIALDAGAEDVRRDGDMWEVTTDPELLEKAAQAFRDLGVELIMNETVQVPKTTVRLEGKPAEKILALMEKLEDLDDVQHVAANFDIPDEVMHEVEQQQ
jgi:YebC/PmpR family DNA-binding regulatory protein